MRHARTRILICSKTQPDDEPVVSKHVAVGILYKVVFRGYLFIPYFNKCGLFIVRLFLMYM